jgi:hypothetical protein
MKRFYHFFTFLAIGLAYYRYIRYHTNMNENMRKIDLDRETSSEVQEILSYFPADCIKDKDRLCQRITTVVARTEHNLKFGTPLQEIHDKASDAAVAVGERCFEGITIDDDRRTECGYGKGFDQPVNVFPKWLFTENMEVIDGDI